MKNSPVNPFSWFRSTQDWFTRAERSSGFRPYLIFLIIVILLAICLLRFFGQDERVVNCAVFLLYGSVGAFILLFSLKCVQDPDFCRSEKHVETVKRLTLAEQKGDTGPMALSPETIAPIQNVAVAMVLPPKDVQHVPVTIVPQKSEGEPKP